MSNELDLELSRLFAAADQPLEDGGFHARVVERLNRPNVWLRAAWTLTSIGRAALSGLAAGTAAPFRLRTGRISLMAISGAALMIWMTLRIV